MTAPPSAVVQLIGSPLTPSNTGAVAEALVDALVAAGLVTATRRDVIELAAISGITFTAERAVGRAPMADPFGVVRAADLLIVATPTLVGAYAGILKLFLDHFRPGQLAGVVAVPVALVTCRDDRQAVASSLKTLLARLGAIVPTPALAVQAQGAPGPATARWVARHGLAIYRALDRQSADGAVMKQQ